jgi:hypothetical protein
VVTEELLRVKHIEYIIAKDEPCGRPVDHKGDGALRRLVCSEQKPPFFWPLSALHAHTKSLYKRDSLWRGTPARALNRPRGPGQLQTSSAVRQKVSK